MLQAISIYRKRKFFQELKQIHEAPARKSRDKVNKIESVDESEAKIIENERHEIEVTCDESKQTNRESLMEDPCCELSAVRELGGGEEPFVDVALVNQKEKRSSTGVRSDCSMNESGYDEISFQENETSKSYDWSHCNLDDSLAAFPIIDPLCASNDVQDASECPQTPPTQVQKEQKEKRYHLQAINLASSLRNKNMSDRMLEEYFDLDRFCEITPCWLLYSTYCAIHESSLSHPSLLFCIQVSRYFLNLNFTA